MTSVTGVKTCALPICMLALGFAVSLAGKVQAANPSTLNLKVTVAPALSIAVGTATYSFGYPGVNERSEERRVGKECRSRWGRAHEKENTGRKRTKLSI